MSEHSLGSLPLGPGGRMTSKLGFGCSGISGGLAKRQSLALLEAAYDAGIRHFDVAPMYGFGTAEDVVGEFAQRHVGRVTITTKYGIPAPASGAAINTLRTLVRPLANRLPALRRSLIRKATEVASSSPQQKFSLEGAARSLEDSLRKLRVDQLDLLLLHEAELSDLLDDRLLSLLEDAQKAGKLVNFGVASSAHIAEEIHKVQPGYCPVLQHEWSVLAPATFAADCFHICHRTIAGVLESLNLWFKDSSALQAKWSSEVGLDLSNSERLAELLLQISCLQTPGIVLFSSRQQKRIQRHADGYRNASTSASALRLAQLIRANTAEILSRGKTDIGVQDAIPADSAVRIG